MFKSANQNEYQLEKSIEQLNAYNYSNEIFHYIIK